MRAWFYPGDNYGHEFVYPKVKAVELAKANNQPVASMPNELAANTTKPTKTMQRAARDGAEAGAPEGSTAHPGGSRDRRSFPSSRASGSDAVAANMPKKLPKTASPLPLVGLIGLLSLGTAGLLRRTSASWK